VSADPELEEATALLGRLFAKLGPGAVLNGAVALAGIVALAVRASGARAVEADAGYVAGACAVFLFARLALWRRASSRAAAGQGPTPARKAFSLALASVIGAVSLAVAVACSFFVAAVGGGLIVGGQSPSQNAAEAIGATFRIAIGVGLFSASLFAVCALFVIARTITLGAGWIASRARGPT
jgi:hypothetical protein